MPGEAEKLIFIQRCGQIWPPKWSVMKWLGDPVVLWIIPLLNLIGKSDVRRQHLLTLNDGDPSAPREPLF
jgi:hypothetical protein